MKTKSGRHILYNNGAKKTKENISIVTLLQHFDDIFELHPSLEIENVCFRNLRIEGFKNTLALLLIRQRTGVDFEKQLTPFF